MIVEVIGGSDPKYAIMACIHGDETCGAAALEKLRKMEEELKKPLKLILANERAYEEGKHYIDRDLNRSFPGDKTSDLHEEKIAAELTEELEGMKVLDLHSSKEDEKKFGIVTTSTEDAYRRAISTGLDRIVDFSNVDGCVIPNCVRIAAECGILGTENAKETAFNIARNFLAAEGVLNEKFERQNPEFYRIFEKVRGSGFSFLGTNFKKVKGGEIYAVKGEKEKKAEEGFFPVLMSDTGYEDYIGFKAEKFDPF